MTWWQAYGSFLVFAVILILVPGPDFAVVLKSALSSGRRGAAWASVGVATSNPVQGIVAVIGLGAVIVASQPIFTTIKWAGVAYLVFLGVQALHSAWRGRYASADDRTSPSAQRAAIHGWRQGFLSNITNPKVLVCSTWLPCRNSFQQTRRCGRSCCWRCRTPYWAWRTCCFS